MPMWPPYTPEESLPVSFFFLMGTKESLSSFSSSSISSFHLFLELLSTPCCAKRRGRCLSTASGDDFLVSAVPGRRPLVVACRVLEVDLVLKSDRIRSPLFESPSSSEELPYCARKFSPAESSSLFARGRAVTSSGSGGGLGVAELDLLLKVLKSDLSTVLASWTIVAVYHRLLRVRGFDSAQDAGEVRPALALHSQEQRFLSDCWRCLSVCSALVLMDKGKG